jgi:threonine dehydrogenase-like Zn-dependent dehydrogenase
VGIKRLLLLSVQHTSRISSIIVTIPFLFTTLAMALTNLTAAVNATMRAVLWEGNAYNVTVADVPRPSIINTTDAIVKLSRAAICGSDLHIYRGTNPGPAAPWILGHEGIGYISEIGEGVNSLAVGDSVIIPFATAEGHVHTSLTTQMYGGYGNGGDMGGTQGWYKLLRGIWNSY